MRRCRRSAALRGAAGKKADKPSADFVADTPPSDSPPRPEGGGPFFTAGEEAEARLTPVRVDPTLLPVDAYHGVPYTKQFVL